MKTKTNGHASEQDLEVLDKPLKTKKSKKADTEQQSETIKIRNERKRSRTRLRPYQRKGKEPG